MSFDMKDNKIDKFVSFLSLEEKIHNLKKNWLNIISNFGGRICNFEVFEGYMRNSPFSLNW